MNQTIIDTEQLRVEAAKIKALYDSIEPSVQQPDLSTCIGYAAEQFSELAMAVEEMKKQVCCLLENTLVYFESVALNFDDADLQNAKEILESSGVIGSKTGE